MFTRIQSSSFVRSRAARQETQLTEPETQTDIPTQATPHQAVGIEGEVAQAVDGWKADSKRLGQLAVAMGALCRASTYGDLNKVPAIIQKARDKAIELNLLDQAEPILQRVTEDLRERRKRMHENLAKDLVAACGLKNLDLRVIRREEPVEVRIPPLGVTIDRAKGRASLHFARQPLVECVADAQAIVQAHQEAMSILGGRFDGPEFFVLCRKAWAAACGAGHGGTGDRVEILDFMPYLALQMQTKAFKINPSKGNFRGYSRAQFAFDVMQLQKRSKFTQDGWRFNLGVATGTTASKKDRTIFFEDQDGNGEFKLTVFFVRVEGSR